MESSGAEDQASESVNSAGVTIKPNESAEPVPTDDSKGEADSAVTADAGSEEAAVVPGRSRVREAEDSISELTQLLDNARNLSAELETDENDGVRSCSAAMDKVLRDDIEVSDVCLADDPEEDLRLRFVAAMTLCEDEAITMISATGEEAVELESSANEIDLADYAHELAFLPDLTDSALTVLDYASKNVVCTAHTESQRSKLVEMLKKQEGIMIASGNALPPPAYGAICDIDVQGHTPIKQRARRVPLKHLKKLYELLKGLLKAGLIAFSKSPWASPIVIVLKKNGVDIRLCIDYKMVNAITVLMEYAMPLVDDLLTELESYLWFCSLDAASGFWAVMMTRRAREISAFVCALGHFEWLRMPFGLKNAPMIYQRIIDNALWGYVQPRGGWAAHAERVRRSEAASAIQRSQQAETTNQLTQPSPSSTSKFEADHRASAESDPLQDLVNGPDGDMFTNGETDVSALTPVFKRRSFVDDICFGGATFDECLDTLSRLLARFAECRISISFTKSIFVQPAVDFLSHEISSSGIRANPAKMAAIAELPFPKSKKECKPSWEH
ncbi:hypothetical protein PF011_g29311 [Phytophthora fragariae]|uniref:Reverse transcriptase domain-containing protein n=1 Tax=Phytophthora fragariae TaxID=53985 RepID=A0A6A3H0F2_9STRA|nr:hypothetical protein PF011_g29311 [Phytophthora fragariae]